MGLKVKANFNADRNFPIGIVKAKIIDFNVYRDNVDEIVLNSQGHFGYKVIFEEDNGCTISEIFWWSEKTIFWLRKLLKAIKLNKVKQPKFSEIIGNTVWLHVAKEYLDNDRYDNPEKYNPKIIKFQIYYDDESKPVVSDNSQHFIVEVHRELKEVELPKPLSNNTKEFLLEGIKPELNKIENLLSEEDKDEIENEFGF